MLHDNIFVPKIGLASVMGATQFGQLDCSVLANDRMSSATRKDFQCEMFSFRLACWTAWQVIEHQGFVSNTANPRQSWTHILQGVKQNEKTDGRIAAAFYSQLSHIRTSTLGANGQQGAHCKQILFGNSIKKRSINLESALFLAILIPSESKHHVFYNSCS